MRRFWNSTEFYTTSLTAVLILAVGPSVQEPILSGAVCALADLYIMGRTLWKKNRGQFYTGFKCSEFYFLLAAQAWLVAACLFGHLPATHAVILLTINQGVYNVARGVTKSIGVKSQMVFG